MNKKRNRSDPGAAHGDYTNRGKAVNKWNVLRYGGEDQLRGTGQDLRLWNILAPPKTAQFIPQANCFPSRKVFEGMCGEKGGFRNRSWGQRLE